MVKNNLNKSYVYHILISLFLGVFSPYFSRLLGFNELTRLALVYFLINGVYMLYLGLYTRKRGLTPFILVVLPLGFSVLATLLWQAVSTDYGFYFSGLYLILGLFTFFGDTRDDPDEDMIQIEHDFQSDDI
ncbi:hypothetical protein C5L23_001366 [Leuconostoc fallax]|uniref:Uncharacterized protein n=2 Tax=Leuconostoc fallax TaxID=1251 RepID=A0A4R5N702_9LACO|nr:hypothetical protein [Leuconostoc fallax]TDG67567.1 hypothetical protein C5L23_001366 [Leuconostoc fallax]